MIKWLQAMTVNILLLQSFDKKLILSFIFLIHLLTFEGFVLTPAILDYF